MICYTTSYNTNYDDTITEVFENLDAVISRLKLMKLHNSFDEYETLTIKCQKMLTSEEMQSRYKRVKEHCKS